MDRSTHKNSNASTTARKTTSSGRLISLRRPCTDLLTLPTALRHAESAMSLLTNSVDAPAQAKQGVANTRLTLTPMHRTLSHRLGAAAAAAAAEKGKAKELLSQLRPYRSPLEERG